MRLFCAWAIGHTRVSPRTQALNCDCKHPSVSDIQHIPPVCACHTSDVTYRTSCYRRQASNKDKAATSTLSKCIHSTHTQKQPVQPLNKLTVSCLATSATQAFGPTADHLPRNTLMEACPIVTQPTLLQFPRSA